MVGCGVGEAVRMAITVGEGLTPRSSGQKGGIWSDLPSNHNAAGAHLGQLAFCSQ